MKHFLAGQECFSSSVDVRKDYIIRTVSRATWPSVLYQSDSLALLVCSRAGYKILNCLHSYLDTNYIKLLVVILTSTGLLLVHVNHLDLTWSHTETIIESLVFNQKYPNRNLYSELFHLSAVCKIVSVQEQEATCAVSGVSLLTALQPRRRKAPGRSSFLAQRRTGGS